MILHAVDLRGMTVKANLINMSENVEVTEYCFCIKCLVSPKWKTFV